MDFRFKSIAHIFKETAAEPKEPKQSPLDKVRGLMASTGDTENELKAVVVGKEKYPADVPIDNYDTAFLNGWVIRYWKDIIQIIRAGRTE